MKNSLLLTLLTEEPAKLPQGAKKAPITHGEHLELGEDFKKDDTRRNIKDVFTVLDVDPPSLPDTFLATNYRYKKQQELVSPH
jgi:hypothetical protein